jgi:hypothetical protein
MLRTFHSGSSPVVPVTLLQGLHIPTGVLRDLLRRDDTVALRLPVLRSTPSSVDLVEILLGSEQVRRPSPMVAHSAQDP